MNSNGDKIPSKILEVVSASGSSQDSIKLPTAGGLTSKTSVVKKTGQLGEDEAATSDSPRRSIKLVFPKEVQEADSLAEDSASDASTEKKLIEDSANEKKKKEKKDELYTEKLAKKYHFVEVYLRDASKVDETVQSLYEPPKQQDSLK